jgi:quercetin dioxygenase-like cupin family protein
MKRIELVFAFCLLFVFAMAVLAVPRACAQEGVTRTPILKQDLEADPSKEVTLFIADYKPGAKTGKHYHPGQEFIYVLEGHGVMEEVGKSPVDMKPGGAIYFRSDPKKPTYVHEATNLSQADGMKLLVILITDKGQPLVYPVK